MSLLSKPPGPCRDLRGTLSTRVLSAADTPVGRQEDLSSHQCGVPPHAHTSPTCSSSLGGLPCYPESPPVRAKPVSCFLSPCLPADAPAPRSRALSTPAPSRVSAALGLPPTRRSGTPLVSLSVSSALLLMGSGSSFTPATHFLTTALKSSVGLGSDAPVGNPGHGTGARGLECDGGTPGGVLGPDATGGRAFCVHVR